MVSSEFHYVRVMLEEFDRMSTKDMMKLALLNDRHIEEDGTALIVMRLLAHKFLEISPPNVETEFN